MKKIFIQVAIIVAIMLGGCAVPHSEFVTVSECKVNASLDLDHAADELCPSDSIDWDSCPHRKAIMVALMEKLEECDGIR